MKSGFRHHTKLTGLLLMLPFLAYAQNDTYWNIVDGNSTRTIQWDCTQSTLPHYDHIEMSGQQLSVVLRYGVNEDGSFRMERSIVWPLLRTLPNNTHASLNRRFAIDFPSLVMVNGLSLKEEQVQQVVLDGTLSVKSMYATGYINVGAAKDRVSTPVVELTRTFFPSAAQPILCEKYTIKNISQKSISVTLPQTRLEYKTEADKGVSGSYLLDVATLGVSKAPVSLNPGDSVTFYATIQGRRTQEPFMEPNIEDEQQQRLALVALWQDNLVLETPEDLLNTAFAFAKVRASESIYKTKGGFMHGPGGESYYAAIWANDQAEYVNPFFPYLGYGVGNESAFNSYMHFARFMNPEYQPIPSSIIAEGIDIWNGAGDRGDGAMIAYGASRFALELGNLQKAKELWPLIEWCLEYCRRQLNAQGVVQSDTDELEGRFPAGSANLCTSSLYYDALISAAYLSKELGMSSRIAKDYTSRAKELAKAIEAYFGADWSGFHTYQYYQGNDLLRSWICIPLTVGINQRSEGTVQALFSDRLWTANGLLTQEGSTTFWDRSTLYALRGVLAAGATEKAMEHLRFYSRQRLLGAHVPYPIEAWPEGSQRHLSAESGLYCRIITEGLFGLRPTGLHSFEINPRLPQGWERMSLKRIHAFCEEGKFFDLTINRIEGDRLQAVIRQDGKVLKTALIPKNVPLKITL